MPVPAPVEPGDAPSGVVRRRVERVEAAGRTGFPWQQWIRADV